MTSRRKSWIEADAALPFPALMPAYTCPCCGQTRKSVQYGSSEAFHCAECAWGTAKGCAGH